MINSCFLHIFLTVFIHGQRTNPHNSCFSKKSGDNSFPMQNQFSTKAVITNSIIYKENIVKKNYYLNGNILHTTDIL